MKSKIYLSLNDEQQYWDNWILQNDDNTCPLEPFISYLDQDEIRIIDNKLENFIEGSDLYILSTRVNIDNGIFDVLCVKLNEKLNKIYSFAWYNKDDKYKKKYLEFDQNNKSILHILDILEGVSHYDVWVDLSDRMLLDASSLYIKIWYKGKYNRFAIYNPDFDDESRSNSDVPISVFKLLNILSEIENKTKAGEGNRVIH